MLFLHSHNLWKNTSVLGGTVRELFEIFALACVAGVSVGFSARYPYSNFRATKTAQDASKARTTPKKRLVRRLYFPLTKRA